MTLLLSRLLVTLICFHLLSQCYSSRLFNCYATNSECGGSLSWQTTSDNKSDILVIDSSKCGETPEHSFWSGCWRRLWIIHKTSHADKYLQLRVSINKLTHIPCNTCSDTHLEIDGETICEDNGAPRACTSETKGNLSMLNKHEDRFGILLKQCEQQISIPAHLEVRIQALWIIPEEQTTCLMKSTENGGYFQSPLYGVGNYLSGRPCKFEVFAPNSQHIRISFMSFDLDPGYNTCNSDYLTLSSVNNNYTLCGQEIAPVYYFQDSQLTASFQANSDEKFKGFRAHYEFGSFENCRNLSWEMVHISEFTSFTLTTNNSVCLMQGVSFGGYEIYTQGVYQEAYDLKAVTVKIRHNSSDPVEGVLSIICGYLYSRQVIEFEDQYINHNFMNFTDQTEHKLHFPCHVGTFVFVVKTSNSSSPRGISLDISRTFMLLPGCTVAAKTPESENEGNYEMFLSLTSSICTFSLDLFTTKTEKRIEFSLGTPVCRKKGAVLNIATDYKKHSLDLSCNSHEVQHLQSSSDKAVFFWINSNSSITLFNYNKEPNSSKEVYSLLVRYHEQSCSLSWLDVSKMNKTGYFMSGSMEPLMNEKCKVITFVQNQLLPNEVLGFPFVNIVGIRMTLLTTRDVYYNMLSSQLFPSINFTRNEDSYTLAYRGEMKTYKGYGGRLTYWVVELIEAGATTYLKKYQCGGDIYYPSKGILKPQPNVCSYNFERNWMGVFFVDICNVNQNTVLYLQFTVNSTEINEFCRVGSLVLSERIIRREHFCSRSKTGQTISRTVDICSLFSKPHWYAPPLTTVAVDDVKLVVNGPKGVTFPTVAYEAKSYMNQLKTPIQQWSQTAATVGNTLYRRYTYAAGESKLEADFGTWEWAASVCRKNNETLLAIHSSELMKIMVALLGRAWGRDIFGRDTGTMFLGLKQVNRDFRWENGKPFTYAKWYHPATGVTLPEDVQKITQSTLVQPVVHSGQSCVGAYFPTPHDSHWFTMPCYFPLSKFSFICESQNQKVATSPEFKFPWLRPSSETPSLVSVPVVVPAGNWEASCPSDAWIMLNNRCFMMKTSLNNVVTQWSYFKAVQACHDLGGEVADLDVVAPLLPDIARLFLIKPHYGWTYLLSDVSFGCTGFTVEDTAGLVTAASDLVCTQYRSPSLFSYNMFYEQRVALNVLCDSPVTFTAPAAQQCPRNAFRCDNDSTCILSSKVCDGVIDCSSGMDEKDCEGLQTNFTCNDKRTTHVSNVCNFVSDCSNGEDEQECYFRDCNISEWRCSNKQCIPESKWCDMNADCADGSDEENCVQLGQCRYFKCFSGFCLKSERVNDGIVDCEGFYGEDDLFSELAVSRIISIRMPTLDGVASATTNAPYCPNNELQVRCQIDLPKCINRTRLCIAERELELTCNAGQHLQHCTNITCPKYTFKCPSSYCVPLRYVCDGRNDCPEGEDEANCNSAAREECRDLFQCPGSTICLPTADVCNGKVDCLSGEDEMFCDFQCPSGCKCSGYLVSCNKRGLQQLPDVSNTVRALNLAHNSIASLGRKVLASKHSLLELDASLNKLEAIDDFSFKDCKNLRHLNLKGNKIVFIKQNTFSGLINIQELIIIENPIEHIETGAFSSCINLPSLTLSSFYLAFLDKNQFKNMKALTSLTLSNNRIDSVSASAFDGLDSLQNLDISNNPLRNIDADAFKNLRIDTLISSHTWICCLAAEVRRCSPEPNSFSSCEDLMSNEVLKIFVWIFGIMSIAGNIFVFVWRVVYERRNFKVATLLILNLSIADLLMGIYLVIIATADRQYSGEYFLHDSMWRSSSLCKVAGTLAFLSCEVSVCMLTLITLDRFLGIRLSLQYSGRGMRPFIALTVGVWLLFLLVSTIPFSNISYFNQFYGATAVCLPFTLENVFTGGWEYATAFTVVFNSLNLVWIASAYTYIFRHVRQSHKASRRDAEVEEIVLARRLAAIIVSDVLCWLPIISCSIVALSGIRLGPKAAAWLAVFVLPLNSALNPVLYTIASIKVCRGKKFLLQSSNKTVSTKTR